MDARDEEIETLKTALKNAKAQARSAERAQRKDRAQLIRLRNAIETGLKQIKSIDAQIEKEMGLPDRTAYLESRVKEARKIIGHGVELMRDDPYAGQWDGVVEWLEGDD